MTKSGVNPNLYQSYAFEDHVWNAEESRKDDLLELAQRCVKINGVYSMKVPNSSGWARFDSLVDAKKQACNTWMNGYLASGRQITAALIDVFFSGVEKSTYMVGNKKQTSETVVGSCPNLHGQMVIPYGPRFLTYKGLRYLNVAQDDVIQGNSAHVISGQPILRMIYRALCNGPELAADPQREGDLLLQQIQTNSISQLEFRFVINWLAAIVQFPGINLQTNLWIIGDLQGIGKGTLMAVMRRILGGMVGTLNQDEIERGWNNHLFGKVLIEADEFDTKKRNGLGEEGWNKWIKKHTCEAELDISLRNTTSWTTLHIGNTLFTTNDLYPTYLDRTDRRNMIVKATGDKYWQDFASVLRTDCVLKHPQEVAEGFAWILEQVQVDLELINIAPLTQAKAAIQSNSAGSVQAWVFDTEGLSRDVWCGATELHRIYVQWHRDAEPGKTAESSRKFGLEMTKLAENGTIQKRIGRAATEYLIPHDVTGPAPVVGQRKKAAKELAAMIGEDVVIHDHDAVIELHDAHQTKPLTRLERLRACLAAEQDGVVPLFG